VLLLVPEIALTPSVAALFRLAFGNRVAIQHSGLSSGERLDQWDRIRRGDVDVVIGTRSAVFAPLGALGLVIVDEEHDSSYKQDETPRYHGRDVAIVRAQAAGALVVLGSATPSIESFQNARAGKYLLVSLRRRVLDRPLARVSVVNMREEYATEGPGVVISRVLRERIGTRLDQREQVLVLLNRRGYATSVFCRQCGDAFECPNCSVSLTVHLDRARGRSPASAGAEGSGPRGRGRCHYCNYSALLPSACRKCAGPYLEQSGFGTERVEADLRVLFPNARIGRVDRDSMRRKGALTRTLMQFAQGDLDVLVGTQMIAKGHDFPRVTLVGVVSADVGLGLADFRASERTFQLLTQVAGRAGRGEMAGEAVIQTVFPEHYSVQLACRQDYEEFFTRELAFRQDMRYPPSVAMVNIVVRERTLDQAMTLAGTLAQAIRRRATGNVAVLGPAPAPMERLRGEHRVQIFLKGTRRADMRHAVRDALEASAEHRRRITVDVDPLNVL
jgi:primosomal protein N' (replication factor Y)